MATTATERISSVDAGGAPWESDSISTWPDGDLGLVGSLSAEAEAPATAPWPTTRTLTGNGQTWTEEITATVTNGSDETVRLSVFSADLSSPSTGVLTAGGTGTPGPAAVFFKGLSVSEQGTGIVQSASNSGTGTAVSVPLSAFADATNNIVVMWVAYVNGFGSKSINISSSSLTELGADIDGGFDVSIAQFWSTGEDTSPDVQLSASTSWVAVAMEIDSDAGGGGGGTSIAGEIPFSTFALEGEISNIETRINSEIPFSAFALEGTISNTGVTVNPVAEIDLGTFSTLVTDITAYISGFTEIVFGTFDLDGDIQGEITAVIEGAITFATEVTATAIAGTKSGIAATILVGTELALASARITQKIAATVLDAGVTLIGAMSGVIPLSNATELIRTGATFVTGSIRSLIRTITRRY